MAYQFDFDRTNRILRCKFSGRVTDEDLKTCYGMIAELARALDPEGGVADFSNVTSFEVSAQTVRELARLAPAMPKPSRPRVIAAIAPDIFGLARIFELEGEATRPNLHVVRTVKEAQVILGVQKPQFEPIAADMDSARADFSS